MTILQKGLPSDYFKSSINYLPLILASGICCVFIAIGTMVGGWLHLLELRQVGVFIFPATIFLFLGLGLITSFAVLNRINKK